MVSRHIPALPVFLALVCLALSPSALAQPSLCEAVGASAKSAQRAIRMSGRRRFMGMPGAAASIARRARMRQAQEKARREIRSDVRFHAAARVQPGAGASSPR